MVALELKEVLLHVGLKFPESKKKKVGGFVARLSLSNLTSIKEIKKIDKNLLQLITKDETAALIVDGAGVLHLITSKISGATLDDSNTALNETLQLLRDELRAKKVGIKGVLILTFEADEDPNNIIPKFVPKERTQKMQAKTGLKLKVKGLRCSVGKNTSLILDTRGKRRLTILHTGGFEMDYPANFLKDSNAKAQRQIKRILKTVRDYAN